MTKEQYIKSLRRLYKYKEKAIKGIKDGLNISYDKKLTIKNIKDGSKNIYNDAVLGIIDYTFMKKRETFYDYYFDEANDYFTNIISKLTSHGAMISHDDLERLISHLNYEVSISEREKLYNRIKNDLLIFNPERYIKYLEKVEFDPQKHGIDFLEEIIIKETFYINRSLKTKDKEH